MISENISLPKSIKEAEDRFIIKLKENLLRMIKEINRLEKKIMSLKEIEEIEDLSDLLDLLRGKANIDASNVGSNFDGNNGAKNQNKLQWSNALSFDSVEIADDNKQLVCGKNVHEEGHPPFTTDETTGQPANPYNYLNRETETVEIEVPDQSSQSGYSTEIITQINPISDVSIADNLILLDTAIKAVSDRIVPATPVDLSGKANVSLNNITTAGQTVIGDIARSSILVKSDNPHIFVTKTSSVVNGLTVDTYALDSDYSSGGGSIDTSSLANRDASNVSLYSTEWGEALGSGVIRGTGSQGGSDPRLVSASTLSGELVVDSSDISTITWTDGDGVTHTIPTIINVNDTTADNLVALNDACRQNKELIDNLIYTMYGSGTINNDSPIYGNYKGVFDVLSQLVNDFDAASVSSAAAAYTALFQRTDISDPESNPDPPDEPAPLNPQRPRDGWGDGIEDSFSFSDASIVRRIQVLELQVRALQNTLNKVVANQSSGTAYWQIINNLQNSMLDVTRYIRANGGQTSVNEYSIDSLSSIPFYM